LRVEAVVADLDGTVVRSDFSISRATLMALDTLRAAGIPLIVATARTPQGLEHFQEIARRSDMASCCSGSIGWSSREQVITWKEMLTPDAIRCVVDIAVDNGAGVASYDSLLWRMTDEYFRLSPTQPHGPTRVVVEASVLAETACCTMALRHSSGDINDIAAVVAAATGTGALSHVGRSTVLDVTREGIDKGTGTVRALRELGIDPQAAISFGDMPNDLSMFRVTGRSYSVGRSDSEVMRVVSEVLPSVEEDGFAGKIAALARAGWHTDPLNTR
jgi:hydroxymethylpyrimidine pyrophosphatase-like HAD family hydrolase